MWVVCRLSVFCEPFTDRAFGVPFILKQDSVDRISLLALRMYSFEVIQTKN